MSDFIRLHRKPKLSKYVRGEQINSMVGFSVRMKARLPVYVRGKFMAAGFIEHWSWCMIQTSIRYGHMRCADRRKDDGHES